MAGRPKKPTALKELTGTLEKSRANPNEPRPDVAVPDMPMWVADDPMTASLYDQVTQYVVDMRVGTRADGVALALLADQLAMYLELRQQVREEGAVIEIEGSQGQIKKQPNPALQPMNTAFANIHKMLREYGLTAASRSSVDAQPEKEINSFDDFMKM
jgi:P27 family predicted phage terminase small subunit